MNIKF